LLLALCEQKMNGPQLPVHVRLTKGSCNRYGVAVPIVRFPLCTTDSSDPDGTLRRDTLSDISG